MNLEITARRHHYVMKLAKDAMVCLHRSFASKNHYLEIVEARQLLQNAVKVIGDETLAEMANAKPAFIPRLQEIENDYLKFEEKIIADVSGEPPVPTTNASNIIEVDPNLFKQTV